jgi:hypothetical protein
MDLAPQFMTLFAALRSDELAAKRAGRPVIEQLRSVSQQLAEKVDAVETDAAIPAKFGLLFAASIEARQRLYEAVIVEVERRGDEEDDKVMEVVRFVQETLVRIAHVVAKEGAPPT